MSYLKLRFIYLVISWFSSLFPGLPPEKADGVFEVPDAEAQESYIFNKFGQHVITKDLMTGITKFKMSYTQTTSTGKDVQTQIFIYLNEERKLLTYKFFKLRAKHMPVTLFGDQDQMRIDQFHC